jgi:hypothetical protein
MLLSFLGTNGHAVIWAHEKSPIYVYVLIINQLKFNKFFIFFMENWLGNIINVIFFMNQYKRCFRIGFIKCSGNIFLFGSPFTFICTQFSI